MRILLEKEWRGLTEWTAVMRGLAMKMLGIMKGNVDMKSMGVSE